VSVIVKDGRRERGFRFLSEYASDGESVYVALDPFIATAVTGGRHVRTDMDRLGQGARPQDRPGLSINGCAPNTPGPSGKSADRNGRLRSSSRGRRKRIL